MMFSYTKFVIFQFHAMDTLHKNGYDMTRAIAALVPQGGPVLCRDEMEEWSASEANLFEEALEKYGKDFTDIQQDFVSLYLHKQKGDFFSLYYSIVWLWTDLNSICLGNCGSNDW